MTARPYRILHIEDNRNDADLILLELERQHIPVNITRVETEEALKQALDDPETEWDIILSDHELRDFDSSEALAILKKTGRDIPFVIISGAIGEESAVEAMRSGAQDYIPKGRLSRLIPVLEREIREAGVRRERRAAEQAALHAEKMFTVTFMNAAVGIAHTDLEGRIMRTNPKFCEIIGYPLDEISKLHFQEITHPDDLSSNAAIFRSLFNREIDQYALEKRYIRKDGSICWVQLTVSLILTDTDEPSYCLAIVEDINERKAATEALKASEERLRISEERYQRVIQGSNEGYWDFNVKANRVYWSNKLFEMLGLPLPGTGDNQTQTYEWFESFLPEDEKAAVRGAFFRAVEQQVSFDQHFRMRKVSGELIYCHSRGTPYYDESGVCVQVAGMIADITVQKEAEFALLEYKAKLEESNRDLQQFAAIASHDLKEPLRKVAMFSDLLVHQVGPEGQDYINRILNAIERMQNLIDNLLELSRINRQEKIAYAVDLNRLVTLVLEDLQVSIAESGAEIRRESLCTVKGDERQLQQVFQNLLSNALKFHQPEVKPIISLKCRTLPDGFCQITVSDNGIGFENRHSDRIFKPFERLHRGAMFKGTGIGLAIVKKILQRHGGMISAQSSPGQGSTFLITLPLASPAALEEAAPHL